MAQRSLKASQQTLDNLVDPARIRKRWKQHDEQWAAAADVSLKTLQRFWNQEPIRRANFIAICQAIGIDDWQTIADFSPTSDPDTAVDVGFIPSTYNQSTWVERTEVTATLLARLRSSCRLLVLNGMTGIGKTALVERLVAEIQETEGQPNARSPQKRFCRLNLDDGSISPDFSFSGAALLRRLGDEPTLEDQKDPTHLLSHILQKLRSHPYRVQIDSMERLLEGNDQEGWSDFCDPLWLDLWQQLLAGGDCQSQVIVTTQDVPGQLEAIGSRYPRLWHCELIRGLTEAEQMKLFHKVGLCPDPNTASPPHPPTLGGFRTLDQSPPELGDLGGFQDLDYLQRIGKLYAGHPLVLRVIAEDIKSTGGNIQRYWQQGGFAEQEAHRPAKFSRRRLQLEVKQRVSDALAQLPEDARQLLCRASVYRRPVPASFWFALLPERSEAQQQAALNLLQARSFADEDWEPESWYGTDAAIPLRQHNLIRGVAYEMLQADPTTWETAERRAAERWLTVYEPDSDAPNLEKVRGYLEAFDHYFTIKDYKEAKKIPYTPISKTNVLHWQLYVWSYFSELIPLHRKLLKIAYDNGDKQIEVHALGNLGNAYRSLGEHSEAISYYQQCWQLARKIGDSQSEIYALSNCLQYSNDDSQKISSYQQYLEHSRITQDCKGEIYILCGLANAYYRQNKYNQALSQYKEALERADEIGDLRGRGNALLGLANVCYMLCNYQHAVRYYQLVVAITREIGDRRGEGNALGNLGITYEKLEDYVQATDYAQQHLRLCREIGDRRGEGAGLRELGVALLGLEEYSNASNNLQAALAIFVEVQSRGDEAETLKNLAELHQKTGELDRALEYCDRALQMAIELGIPLVKECEELKQQLEEE